MMTRCYVRNHVVQQRDHFSESMFLDLLFENWKEFDCKAS